METHKVLEKNTQEHWLLGLQGMKKVKGEKRLLNTSIFLPSKGIVELVPAKHERRRGGLLG